MNEEEKIKEIFIKALLEFKNKDLPIMKNDSSERAKVHRVAMYMENFMKQENFDKDYVVDCEYNLVNGERKILPKTFYRDEKKHTLCFYPDLIVHKRNGKNLFCCEFKNKINSAHDSKKIKFLINDEQYKYTIGTTFNFKNLEKENFQKEISFLT